MTSYDYGYDNSAAMAAVIGVVLVALLIGAAVYVVTALALQRLFRRAGHPYPWAAWIPYWNTWVLLELGAQHGAWALLPLAGYLSFIPFLGPLIGFAASVVSFIVLIFAIININKALGKSVVGWTWFGALLSAIWMWVIGFGSDPFDGTRRTGPYFWGSPYSPARAAAAGAQPQQPPYPPYPPVGGPQGGQGGPQQPASPYGAPQSPYGQQTPYGTQQPGTPQYPQYGAQTPDSAAQTPYPPAPQPQYPAPTWQPPAPAQQPPATPVPPSDAPVPPLPPVPPTPPTAEPTATPVPPQSSAAPEPETPATPAEEPKPETPESPKSES